MEGSLGGILFNLATCLSRQAGLLTYQLQQQARTGFVAGEKQRLLCKRDNQKKQDARTRSKHPALKCYFVAFGDR